MQLDQLKRWQWALIGIIVGLMIAYVRTGVEPDNSVSMSLSVREFSQEVGVDDLPGNRQRIEDIVLHPPSDPAESAYHKAVQIVTFKRAVFDEQRKGWVYKPAAIKVELPFKAPGREGGDYGGSFENYMKAVQEENKAVTYQFAWWEVPRDQYLIWTAGCLVVIGGVWPTIISLLVGAGLGPQKKEADYDLDRFGRGKTKTETAPAARRGMTTAEQSQLANLTQNMESDLSPSGMARTSGGVAATASEQPVRKLDGKALEVAQTEKEEEDKEYKGEFYPVAKSGQKKEDK
jgi:hypothetical protein